MGLTKYDDQVDRFTREMEAKLPTANELVEGLTMEGDPEGGSLPYQVAKLATDLHGRTLVWVDKGWRMLRDWEARDMRRRFGPYEKGKKEARETMVNRVARDGTYFESEHEVRMMWATQHEDIVDFEENGTARCPANCRTIDQHIRWMVENAFVAAVMREYKALP
jgi:hypothetical protein